MPQGIFNNTQLGSILVATSIPWAQRSTAPPVTGVATSPGEPDSAIIGHGVCACGGPFKALGETHLRQRVDWVDVFSLVTNSNQLRFVAICNNQVWQLDTIGETWTPHLFFTSQMPAVDKLVGPLMDTTFFLNKLSWPEVGICERKTTPFWANPYAWPILVHCGIFVLVGLCM